MICNQKNLWKKHNNSNNIDICCSWDDDSINKHECTQAKIYMKKSWIFNSSVQKGRQSPYPIGGNACTCLNKPQNWKWISYDKYYHTSGSICKQLSGRKLIFVGDSTMQQTFVAFIYAASKHNCEQQLTYIHSDTLTGHNYGRLNRGHTLEYAIQNSNPDIALVSTGPHVIENSEFEKIIHYVNKTAKKYPKVKIIWKGQHPHGCHENLSDIDKSIQQNMYIRDAYAANKFGCNSFLTTSPLYLRSDAHPASSNWQHPSLSRDCLHSCFPGPINILIPLLSMLL